MVELIERLDQWIKDHSGNIQVVREAAAALRAAEDRAYHCLNSAEILRADLTAARTELTLAQESREGWRQRCEMAEEAAMKDRARIALLEEGMLSAAALLETMAEWAKEHGHEIEHVMMSVMAGNSRSLLGEQADG